MQSLNDTLPGWRDTPTKQAILSFVSAVTDESGPSYVPPAERIAVFDNDGTLWCEQPAPVQFFFGVDRVQALVPQHPEGKDKEPFASLLKGVLNAVLAGGDQALLELVMATHAGMTTKTPGQGQAYLGMQKDKDGEWLQGGNNYTLRVPPNPLVAQFWAMTLYVTGTRCFIENEHEIAGLDSRMDLVKNADGSVDLHFGPAAPAGKESTWAPTLAGRGWFAYFRFYAATEAYFDRNWALPDLVRVN